MTALAQVVTFLEKELLNEPGAKVYQAHREERKTR